MGKLPWIEVLCTVWSGRNPDSGPQVGSAVLTHSSSRAGDPHGSMTRILSLQCFIARPIPFVEKKPRFHSTKCLSQCSKLLRKQSSFIHTKIDDVCKTGTLHWTGQEASIYVLDRYIKSLIS